MIEIDSELIRKMTSSGKRLDNRSFDQYRQIFIETGVVTSAEGSARVKIGDTEVIAGVKIEPGEPFQDTPNEGVLMVNSEFVPLASPDFESGPPGENAVELARIVDRTIRESKSIDFKQLCIKEGEKVWMIFVDIDILDYDGNLIDAACLAATAALVTAKIPDLDEDEKAVTDKKGTKHLPLAGKPIATTFVKIGSSILADPTVAEEKAADARLTVGTLRTSEEVYISALQKGGSHGFSQEEIFEIIEKAKQKGEELRKLVH